MLIEATSRTVFGNVYFLTGNDDVSVGAGVVITSLGESPNHDTEYDAINAFQGQHRITVAGTVNGYDDGVNVLGCELAQTVEILAGGVINAGYNSPVEDSDGVMLDGLNSTLTNRGTINAQGSGAILFTREAGTTVVANFGLIEAGKYGIWVKYSYGITDFTNFGTVESGLKSFFGGNRVDRVTNAGTMHGDVDLWEGDDVYVGTGGLVVGSVLGGAGDDRFVPGSGIDVLDGEDGVDLLDLSGVNGKVTVDLSNVARNRGAEVAGDSYAGIEAISGGARRDVLTGDAKHNALSGNGGRDLLSGGAGVDTLTGGAGADTLTGGADGDVFVFNALSEGGDLITDFQTLSDKIRLDSTAFGFGGVQGGVSAAVFVTATTNQAEQAEDRFIFRTTDATLWYDRDGTGGKAAVLVAEFTDGTVVNFWDLVLA